jgi:hypothetical protein
MLELRTNGRDMEDFAELISAPRLFGPNTTNPMLRTAVQQYLFR